jgi:F0F1-type ATP synthase epsilon subunit
MPDDTKTEADKTTVESQIEDGKTMAVKVYSPFKTYFEGIATTVSAASKTGDFDILPRHHNFITLLVPCDLVVRTDKEDETIPITGGIMHVKADQVTVFLDV